MKFELRLVLLKQILNYKFKTKKLKDKPKLIKTKSTAKKTWKIKKRKKKWWKIKLKFAYQFDGIDKWSRVELCVCLDFLKIYFSKRKKKQQQKGEAKIFFSLCRCFSGENGKISPSILNRKQKIIFKRGNIKGQPNNRKKPLYIFRCPWKFV